MGSCSSLPWSCFPSFKEELLISFQKWALAVACGIYLYSVSIGDCLLPSLLSLKIRYVKFLWLFGVCALVLSILTCLG